MTQRRRFKLSQEVARDAFSLLTLVSGNDSDKSQLPNVSLQLRRVQLTDDAKLGRSQTSEPERH